LNIYGNEASGSRAYSAIKLVVVGRAKRSANTLNQRPLSEPFDTKVSSVNSGQTGLHFSLSFARSLFPDQVSFSTHIFQSVLYTK
jgi:hypothetical protein